MMFKFQILPTRFLQDVPGTPTSIAPTELDAIQAAETDREFASLRQNRRQALGRERWESEAALFGFRGVR